MKYALDGLLPVRPLVLALCAGRSANIIVGPLQLRSKQPAELVPGGIDLAANVHIHSYTDSCAKAARYA